MSQHCESDRCALCNIAYLFKTHLWTRWTLDACQETAFSFWFVNRKPPKLNSNANSSRFIPGTSQAWTVVAYTVRVWTAKAPLVHCVTIKMVAVIMQNILWRANNNNWNFISDLAMTPIVYSADGNRQSIASVEIIRAASKCDVVIFD
jgi:hypothetical protein